MRQDIRGNATLDANTGKELQLSATLGGDFFYRFHYQLFGQYMVLTGLSGVATVKYQDLASGAFSCKY
jgi:hypothetical protein